MRVSAVRPAVGILLATVLGALPASPARAELTWTHRQHDVFVDGRLDREAQVFGANAPERRAVLVPGLTSAWVVEVESLAVSVLPAAAFALTPDGSLATTDEEPEAEGAEPASRVGEDALFFAAGGHSVVLAPHQGLAGAVTRAEVWQAVPHWKALYDAAEPDPDLVEALRRQSRAELTLAFGTWCPDSRRAVPGLLRALDAAANPDLEVRLIAVRRGFKEPLATVRELRVTNVPTLIAERAGGEQGRIVETPVGASFTADLAALLSGQAPAPAADGEEIATGRYLYLDAAGEEVGSETWRLAEHRGGRLLLATIRMGEAVTQVRHAEDADGTSSFLEITRRSGGALSRTRQWLDGRSLRSMTRGSDTGIVEQSFELPEGAIVLSPAAADAGRLGRRLPERGEPSLVLVFRHDPFSPSGLLAELEATPGKRGQVETPVGRLAARDLEIKAEGGTTVWRIAEELAVPVSARLAGGGRLELVELHQAGQD